MLNNNTNKMNYHDEFVVKGLSLRNFATISEDEAKMVLTWRNDYRIRKNMLNNKTITLEEHLGFIDSLKQSQEKLYFIARDEEQYIGCIYLYQIKDNSAYWGFYVRPELLGKSYGILLEYVLLEMALGIMRLNKLSCESLKNNNTVIKMHTEFGFAKIRENGKVAIMEIDKSRWEKNKEMIGRMVDLVKRSGR